MLLVSFCPADPECNLSTRREPRIYEASSSKREQWLGEGGGERAHSTTEFSLRRNGMPIVTAVPVVYDVMKQSGWEGGDFRVPYARRETMFANMHASYVTAALCSNDEWF